MRRALLLLGLSACGNAVVTGFIPEEAAVKADASDAEAVDAGDAGQEADIVVAPDADAGAVDAGRDGPLQWNERCVGGDASFRDDAGVAHWECAEIEAGGGKARQGFCYTSQPTSVMFMRCTFGCSMIGNQLDPDLQYTCEVMGGRCLMPCGSCQYICSK